MSIVLGVLTLAVTLVLSALQAWFVLVPSLAVQGLLLWSRLAPRSAGARGWLGRRTLVEWLMIWLAAVGTTVTVVGALFRGPGWSFVWPWAS